MGEVMDRCSVCEREIGELDNCFYPHDLSFVFSRSRNIDTGCAHVSEISLNDGKKICSVSCMLDKIGEAININLAAQRMRVRG